MACNPNAFIGVTTMGDLEDGFEDRTFQVIVSPETLHQDDA